MIHGEQSWQNAPWSNHSPSSCRWWYNSAVTKIKNHGLIIILFPLLRNYLYIGARLCSVLQATSHYNTPRIKQHRTAQPHHTILQLKPTNHIIPQYNTTQPNPSHHITSHHTPLHYITAQTITPLKTTPHYNPTQPHLSQTHQPITPDHTTPQYNL